MHPDFNLPFHITTDASAVGVGAVLSQWVDGKERLVTCASEILQPPQRKWDTYQREAYACAFAVRKFKSYL